MDPRQLRELVENEINALIHRAAWDEQEAFEKREQRTIETVLRWWTKFETSRQPEAVS